MSLPRLHIALASSDALISAISVATVVHVVRQMKQVSIAVARFRSSIFFRTGVVHEANWQMRPGVDAQ